MRRENEVSVSPALELSPSLVLVLMCLTVAPLVCPPTIAYIIRTLVSGTGGVDPGIVLGPRLADSLRDGSNEFSC